ncbi:MAG: HAD hydrolase family protein [Francisellaceae bacterium]|jgi:3-deoxy-D-manno-octulosonate 8-phosphate phosphatase (KDO 8-P phosphatase)|nr:HAD hydrolase family protein [Francisellaceae bacterium]MBT6208352.1 HAD hydrolase family protein [Francisellaceae bacterium]MBT6539152.1 HAD hydrolase family protein [Francisellaceae bacterium]
MKIKLNKIKCVLSDVDGILTDGRLFYGASGEEIKTFHALDGIGFKSLKQSGLIVGIITARNSAITQTRMQELGVELVYQGVKDKLKQCHEVAKEYNLNLDEIAYIGDDIPDFTLLKAAGFSATVPHAIDEIKQICDYCTRTVAGMGAFREFADLILRNRINE